jgi:hypothetical protein
VGEAKRRKQLDPNWGKAIKPTINNDLAKIEKIDSPIMMIFIGMASHSLLLGRFDKTG